MSTVSEVKEGVVETSTIPNDVESSSENVSIEKKGTAEDQRDMFRMGKLQELRVKPCLIDTLVQLD